MDKLIYFDNSATTNLDGRVFDEMRHFLEQNHSNPSSLYEIAQKSRVAIEKSRENIANYINANKNEVFFTSSGTEANNWAVFGSTIRKKIFKGHIITTAFEHSSVLECIKFLEDFGFEVTYLKPDIDGFIESKSLFEALRKDTIFVSIMYVNNEVGTVQDIEKLCKIVKEYNSDIIFHTDAVQGISDFKVDVKEFNIDLMTISAHKIHGPKGIGALYIKSGIDIENLILGGSQERARRAGTENVANIVGFSKAVDILKDELKENREFRKSLRDYLVKRLDENFENFKINGSLDKRHSGNLNISFENIEKEMLIMNMDFNGICISSGSACSSGSVENSHVLSAMGVEEKWQEGAIRISLGENNTFEEIDFFIEKLKEIFS